MLEHNTTAAVAASLFELSSHITIKTTFCDENYTVSKIEKKDFVYLCL